MVAPQWILNNLNEYITEYDVQLRHGWFQIKIDGVMRASEENFREKVMDEIEAIIAKPYFKAVNDFDSNKISEDEYLGKIARYTDVFQILRNIRSDYDLPKSALLNPNHS